VKLLDFIDPPLRRQRAIGLALYFAGVAMCLSFLLSDPRQPHIWFFAVALTGLRAVAGLRLRFAWPARIILGLFNALFLYEAIAFGLALAWTTPLWLRLITPLLCLGFSFRRIPLSLAIGPWILWCLLGWRHQENTLRCEDLTRVRDQQNVSILIPTADVKCSDESFVIGRYPRRLWEAPEGNRWLVTTSNVQFSHSGIAHPSPFTGAICGVSSTSFLGTRCFGEGTAQAIREGDHRLYVAAYQQRRRERGVLYALDPRDPMKVLAEARFLDDTGEMFVDEKADVIGLPNDQLHDLSRVRASDLAPLESLPVHFDPGDSHSQNGEGIFCFASGPLFPDGGQGYASIAFRSAPFAHHLLAPSSSYPSSWASFTWGCDWDPVSRRAFVASANLGWLGVIDFDSGRYLARHFVGLGIRAVTWDPQRKRLYLGDFLRGEVFAIDPESGRELGRWFAGRFVRQIVISRDGRALLVTSNAGVVRIAL
jgi:hypothetical protein